LPLSSSPTDKSGSQRLSLSDAVRVFLTRVAAEKELPFTLRVPNTETQAAMNEAEEIARSHRARFSNSEELFASLEEKNGGQ
jgi:DNA-damage-inducible protein J